MRRSTPSRLSILVALLFALPLLPHPALAQNVGTFASGLTYARGLAFDAQGRLYLTQRSPTSRIVRCTPPSNAMSPFASGFVDPIEMVFDAAGNLYVTDYNLGNPGGAVYKVTPAGVKTLFASVPNPSGIAIDPAGNLYVAEYFARKVALITPAGAVSIYADLTGIDPNGRHVTLYRDTDGTIYVANAYGYIYKIAPGGSPVTQFNRSGLSCNGFTKGPDGNFYAASYTDNEIWQIKPDGVGTLYAGAHGVAGHVDGPLLSARFDDPSGLASFGDKLYVAEYSNNDIRALDVDLSTPAQAGTWGRIKAAYR